MIASASADKSTMVNVDQCVTLGTNSGNELPSLVHVVCQAASNGSHATLAAVPSLAAVRDAIATRPAVVLYFTSPTCAVCHALKPKLLDAIGSTFDDVELILVDISQSPDVSSQFGVFAVPTVLAFFDGKEFVRRTRNMRVEEVIDAMRRPYEILMS